MKLYYNKSVWDAALDRIRYIYDNEENVLVNSSGGKDSTVVTELAIMVAREKGRLPVVVIEKSMNDRRASTVRHNRARGSHSVEGMSDLVYQMLKDGWSDVQICNELGMEADELIRLKYVTGFAKLYEKKEFNKACTPSHLKEEDFSEGDN